MLTRSFGATVWSLPLLIASLLPLPGSWARSRPHRVRRGRIEAAQALVLRDEGLPGPARIVRERARRGDEALQRLRHERGLPVVEIVRDRLAVELVVGRLREREEPGAGGRLRELEPRDEAAAAVALRGGDRAERRERLRDLAAGELLLRLREPRRVGGVGLPARAAGGRAARAGAHEDLLVEPA